MAAGLVLDRSTERPHGVDVLEFAAGAQLVGADRPHRHVGVDPHRALFHLGVADIDGEEDVSQLRDVRLGVLDRADVGAAHDLDERHAGAVVVDQRVRGVVDAATATDVGGLPGVLFDVSSLDADHGAIGKGELPVGVGRLVVLGRLKILRHVGVEVVLPRHDRRVGRRSRGPDRAAWRTRPPWPFITGSEPGRPTQVGHTFVFGSWVNTFGQPQNSLVAVWSSTWTSRPTTSSHSSGRDGSCTLTTPPPGSGRRLPARRPPGRSWARTGPGRAAARRRAGRRRRHRTAPRSPGDQRGSTGSCRRR